MYNFVLNKLVDLGIPRQEFDRYDEPHRFYHNRYHILSMIEKAKDRNILTDGLFLAIVFHDIIYNPKADDNEEKSAKLFHRYYSNEDVGKAILETKLHRPTTELSKQLCDLDLEILRSDYETFIDFENKIFKEYQFVDYNLYRERRVNILSDLGVDPAYIQYVKNRKPSIGVYAGSFNPFHIGHYNILQKAEKIFDKVIIARGINDLKGPNTWDLPKEIQYRQIEKYKGLLTYFINGLGYEVTLIRGLRNNFDFNNELIQYRFLQDLDPKIKVVSIFCDKEYEHVSSSAIRTLKSYDKDSNYTQLSSNDF